MVPRSRAEPGMLRLSVSVNPELFLALPCRHSVIYTIQSESRTRIERVSVVSNVLVDRSKSVWTSFRFDLACESPFDTRVLKPGTSGDISKQFSFILDGKWLVSTYVMVITKLIRLSTIAESIFMTNKLRIPKILQTVVCSCRRGRRDKLSKILTMCVYTSRSKYK